MTFYNCLSCTTYCTTYYHQQLEGSGESMVAFASDLGLSCGGRRVRAAALRMRGGFDLHLALLATSGRPELENNEGKKEEDGRWPDVGE